MKNPETQTDISINNVLFATDFSPAADAAFSYAAAIADRYQSRLYVAHVINLEGFDLLESEAARSSIRQAREEAERKIAQLLIPLRLPPDRYQVVVAEGVISDALIDIVQKHRMDLVVLGTHGRRAFKKLLLGSIAEEVFRTAPCPVLTVGPKTAQAAVRRELRHILYAAEFAPDRSNAAPYAVSLAERYGATLTVMNVREDIPAAPTQAEEFSQPFQRWIRDHIPQGSSLHDRLRFERGFGPVTNAIVEFAAKEGVDMIVMHVSEQDPTIAAHLPRANSAYELISRSPCPVLTIR